jgi:tetratricopeptide (TPR) repeat protein
VLRFIAAGGMGEVYEADDLELGVRVALKTLRPEITGNARALERFKQEIALARKVTHRNVCRIFDVGWHRDQAGSGEAGQGVAFLTMEILPGETLAEHLRREGPMSPERANPLLQQMAEALAAAHKAGVIHRDFKSANVMLVPTHDGFRAVVTDFGLAQTGVSLPLAASGEVAGTPAYMAPEQLQGGSVGPAADVYAFGVVMCEVLLGRRPFSGDCSLDSALLRLRRGETSVDLRGAELGRRWEPVVLRCLENEPSSRYADGTALHNALDRAAGGGRTKRAVWISAVAAGAVILAVAAVFFLLPQKGKGPATPGGPSASRAPRRSVAVLGFKNLSGQAASAWLSTALSEMLTTELAAGDQLRTVPGETISRMKLDLGVSDAESLAPDTLAKIRTNLGADFVVMGSYVALGGASGSLRLDIRLQDAAAGETLAALAETGTEARLFELASSAGAALRAKLGAGSVTVVEAAAAQASLPSDPRAARLYAQGLDRMRVLEVNEALRLFEEAAAVEPSHPLIHLELAEAWSNLGYDSRARAEAKKAFDLSSSLPKEGRLRVEARYRTTSGELDKALDIYRALWGFFPDNMDYGLQLADLQTKAGKGEDALATVEELRRMPAPSSADPRIDLKEAEAAQSLADWKHMEAAAQRAGQAAWSRGARLLLAQARMLQARAWRKLGELPKATQAAGEAQSIYEAVGDREGAAHAQSVEAFILSAKGETAQAKKMYTRLLATYREIGNQRGSVMMLNALANLAYDQGDLAAAAANYESCLKVLREIDDKSSAARISGNWANVLLLQGDAAGARRRHEDALALSREVGDRSASAYSLVVLGEIEVGSGDIAGALARDRESLALFRQTGEKSGEAYALYGTGEASLARGDFAGARKAHGEALALREELGEDGAVGESKLALANVDLEEGHTAQAEASARALLQQFEADPSAEDAALARDLIARACLAQMKLADAKAAVGPAAAYAKSNEDRGIQLAVGLTAARVQAADGDGAGARKALETLVRDAARSGRQDLAFKARLALGELEMSEGREASGRAQLQALQKECAAKGFALIAARAAAPLKSPKR